jgi:hypothetical protein
MIKQLDTMEFCRAVLAENFIFQPDLQLLALERSAGLSTEPPHSIDTLLRLVQQRLSTNQSFSMIRVGNGEGNAYGMTLPLLSHDAMFATFCTEFNGQNHLGIGIEEAQIFSRRVIAAIDNADMIGFRSFRFDENASIERCIANGNAYAALGITYARQYLCDRLKAGRMQSKLITSAWIHLDLLSRFDELLAIGSKVIVITGRNELHEGFAARLGNRLTAFLSVPVQGFVPEILAASHYGHRFEEICDFLKQDLTGHLVLVGAGLFGKIYCEVAARHGGVALDLGSMFDVLSDHNTRPIFSVYNFEGQRWINA